MADIGITLDTRGQDLTTWLDQTWTQGDYELGQITDSAPITQYGCHGGREPLGRASASASPSSRTNSFRPTRTSTVTPTSRRWPS